MKYSAESFQWQPRLFSAELPCWRLPVPSFSLHLSFWCMTQHIKQHANLLLLFQSCIIHWETQRSATNKKVYLSERLTQVAFIPLLGSWKDGRLTECHLCSYRISDSLGGHTNATFQNTNKCRVCTMVNGCLIVVWAIWLVWANWHYWHRVLQAWFGSPSSSRLSIWLHSWGHITSPVTRWTHSGSSLGDREGSVGTPLTGSVN